MVPVSRSQLKQSLNFKPEVGRGFLSIRISKREQIFHNLDALSWLSAGCYKHPLPGC